MPAHCRSRSHLFLALVAAGLLVSGCPSRSSRAELELWAMGREGEVVAQLLPAFERDHPGVHVRVQQIPWSAAHEKLLTAYVGGAMPDVFQAGNTWLPELAALGALAPLDDDAARSSAVDLADYFPGILDTNRIGGHLYGIPWYVDTRLLFYRRDLLAGAGVEEPPRTWSEWRTAMERIRQHSGPDQYAILLPTTDWQVPVILALQRGADLLRDGGRYGDFESEPFRSAFEFYLGLFRDGLAPRRGQAQVANLYREFAAGLFTFYVSGPWEIGELQHRLPPSLEAAWDTAPMPAPDDSPYPGVSTAGGASLAVFRNSPRRAAAWALIEYLSEPDRQAEFYQLTGDLPPRRSPWIAHQIDRRRHAQAFWKQLQHVRPLPKVPEWEQITAAITRYGEAAVRGDLSAEQALHALDADVDALLAKRRWMLERGKAAEE